MKRLILGSMALCLIASTALAQSDAPPPPPPMQGDKAGMPPPEGADDGGPRAERDHERDHDRDWGRDRDHGRRHKGPRGGPEADGPPPPPPRGAEFVFKRGPMEMRIKCSEFEPIKPCVDGAVALIKELGAMRGAHALPGDDMAPPPPPPAAGTRDAPPPPPAGNDTVK